MYDVIEIMKDLDKYAAEGIRLIGYDVETYKIMNNTMPEIVCATFYDPSRPKTKGYIFDKADGMKHLKSLLLDDGVHLIAHNANFDFLTAALADRSLFPLIVRAYKKGRIHCTKLRERLLLVSCVENHGETSGGVSLRSGHVSLASLAGCLFTYFGQDVSSTKTGDVWRVRYHELAGKPVDEYPIAAVDYAIADAEHALQVFLGQDRRAADINHQIAVAQPHFAGINVIKDAPRQAYAEFCLQFMATVVGVKIDSDRVDTSKAAIIAEMQSRVDLTRRFNVYVPDAKKERGYKSDKKKLQAVFKRAYTLLDYDVPDIYSNPADKNSISAATEPRDALIELINKAQAMKATPTSRIPLSEDQLAELDVLSSLINEYKDTEALWKEGNTFLTALEKAKLSDDSRIRYNANAFVGTGRTSTSDPNMQNLPRGGSVRACIEPAPGHVFLISDYGQAEFRTLGQIIEYEQPETGSEIARQYRADRAFDPHLFAAARMWEIERGEEMTFDEAKAIYADDTDPRYKDLKNFRTLAKVLNFGLAGGLSHVGFVSYARGYGLKLTVAKSEKLCRTWLEVWQEMKEFFKSRAMLFGEDMFGDALHSDAERIYVFKGSERARFLRKYTVSCNTCFQGLAADGGKEALLAIFEECFFVKKSPLYGCVPILFIHDEIVLEAPHDGSEESLLRLRAAAARFEELMVAGMEKFTPDVPAEAEVAISTVWSKDAKSARDENGDLLVWSPKDKQISDAAEQISLTDEQADAYEAAVVRTLGNVEDTYDAMFNQGDDDVI